MKQVLTLVVGIQLTPEDVSKLEATLEAFADACNYVNDNSDPKIRNNVGLHSLHYYDIKARFGLVANMACRACARVAANRKTAKKAGRTVKQFKPTSMDLDRDLFRFREKDWTVSLATIEGRLKAIPLRASNYHRGKLAGQKPTSGQLCKHRDGKYYLHVQVKSEPPQPKLPDNVIGVDFGRRDIAVTSEGKAFSGHDIQSVRDKYSRVRAQLQQKAAKGTRSSRRRCRQLLKRLSGKEKRFQRWQNHNVSKHLVKRAVETQASLCLEDLTGIRQRTNQQPRNKTERRRSNSWAFYQLRQFVTYKAVQAGVTVLYVPPQYTSQTCSQCLHIGLRSGKRFKCGHCGHSEDADLNASRVLRLIGVTLVNLPRGPWLACELTGGLLKAPARIA